jgi:hypothetical protein
MIVYIIVGLILICVFIKYLIDTLCSTLSQKDVSQRDINIIFIICLVLIVMLTVIICYSYVHINIAYTLKSFVK